MHCYEGNYGTRFFYDGDFSGGVFIEVQDCDKKDIRVAIPGEDMVKFAKLICGNQLISAIENWM